MKVRNPICFSLRPIEEAWSAATILFRLRGANDRQKFPDIISLTSHLVLYSRYKGLPSRPCLLVRAIRLGCQGINRALAFCSHHTYSQLTRYICLYLRSLSRLRTYLPQTVPTWVTSSLCAQTVLLSSLFFFSCKKHGRNLWNCTKLYIGLHKAIFFYRAGKKMFNILLNFYYI